MKTSSTKYIGCDAHSSTCSFCVIDNNGVELDNRKIVTNGFVIRNFLDSIPGKKILSFEECGLSFWLYSALNKSVDKLIVCNPVANRQYKKAKTDRLDARNIAQLLRGGFLESVYHNGSKQENMRVIMSSYQDIVDNSTRNKNRFKALFRKYGILITGSNCYSNIDNLNLFKDQNSIFVASQYMQAIENNKIILNAYEKEITELIRSFKEAKILKSIPGIGNIQAARIISQVINPTRFKNKYKFYSYCGLVKHPRISNNKNYGYEYIWGNRTLKCVYKMAAHSALRTNSALRLLYDSLREKGIYHKSAKNAVARKIAALSLSLWKNNRLYDDKLLTKTVS